MPLGTPKRKQARVDLEEIYRRYSYVVYRRCLKLLQDEAEAHDAQQEVFLSLLERPDAFEGRSALGTYLYSVATFVCLDRRRKQSKRNAEWEQKVIDAYTTQKDSIAFDEAVNIKTVMRAIMDELDEKTSAIALYYFVDGFSQKDIGQLVGLSRINRSPQRPQAAGSSTKPWAASISSLSSRIPPCSLMKSWRRSKPPSSKEIPLSWMAPRCLPCLATKRKSPENHVYMSDRIDPTP